MQITRDTIERIYAGWIGKLIGIRLGAPMEGDSEERIRETLGEITGYTADYRNFAADDDSTGPLFFLRAIEDTCQGRPLTAQDVADALLNYAPFEHGFFWWGGYGISTEHTAYLNLRAGIPAPRSGSIEQNGAAVAEQIGGQIFIDTFGLASPGNPRLAADMAEKSASVSHDRNGVYGGRFVAACISLAFTQPDVKSVLTQALQYIPADCAYALAVLDVMRFYEAHADADWREGFRFVHDHYGYDRYPGACHIIPNACVMVLAMLYGRNDFSRSVCICCMCGWDTDCNVGQVGTILGVMNGLRGIDDAWRKPIGDLLICSTVMGALNIQDVPRSADYIAKIACRLAAQEPPEPFRALWMNGADALHFEYPGSTHAMRARTAGGEASRAALQNTLEAAHTGNRSLRVSWKQDGQPVYVYQKTYYTPADFNDSRYDPAFSPTLYPGQTVSLYAMPAADSAPVAARAYARDSRTGHEICGTEKRLCPGEWTELRLDIPPMDGALIDEAGVLCRAAGQAGDAAKVYLDDMRFIGQADYLIDLSKETREEWTFRHNEISQFTRLKGQAYLSDGQLQLSCADFGAVYTGSHGWTDYAAAFVITPVTGEKYYVNVRVQGAIRSYAAGFDGSGCLALLKNENGWRRLQCVDFPWEHGRAYRIYITVNGGSISVRCEDAALAYTDTERPYLSGSVGLSVENGSHLSCASIRVCP